MSSVPRKIAYNAVFSAAAKMTGTVLALVGIGFITRYLGKDGFGDYSTVLAFFFFFGALADLGLYTISTREISRPGSDEKEILGNVFSIRLASSLFIVLVSFLIVIFLPYPEPVKLGIIISALAYVFSSGYSVLIGLFQKRLAMDKVATGELAGKIVQVSAIVLAVKYNLGFLAIIGTLFLNMLVSFFIVYVWSRRYIKFSPAFDFSAWKKFLKESYPVGISAIIVFAYFKLDTILLSVMKTSADVGIYNAAYKVLENISFFPSMFVGLVMPIMSRYIFHERKKFEIVADNTFKVFLILTVPLFIGTVFLAGGIIRLIGGAGFSESVPVLRLLSAAMVFIFFGNFFTNVIIAGSLQKKMLGILLFCAVFNISLNLFLIPRFSYMGAALTSSLTEGLVAILSFWAAWRNLQYVPSFSKIIPILVSGAGMAFVFHSFQNLSFPLQAVSGVVVYFLLLWLFRAISLEEVRSLINKQNGEPAEFEPIA
ncbi:MAG: flippase [Candidatus Moranbacteria bacterium]|nr:flippase [Candidatus Moranbacteria bacterium]